MNLSRIVTGLLLLSRVCLRADETPRNFAWRQDIDQLIDARTLYRIRLPGEVFDGCFKFPDDVRVFSEDGVRCPHWIWRPAPRVDETELTAETVNSSWIPAEWYRRIDLLIRPNDNAAPWRHNTLFLDTSGHRFLRRVELFGRDPGEEWALLGRGWVFRDPDEPPGRNERIDYPESSLRELQLRVYADARKAREVVSLRHISVRHRRRHGGQMEMVPLQLVTSSRKDNGPGAQVLKFDTGHRNRPIDRLSVNTATADFVRSILIQGRNHHDENWTYRTSGAIQRIGDRSQNTVDLSGHATRHLKITVFNRHDPPLDDIEVRAEAIPHFVIFEAPVGGRVSLYFGNRFAEAPGHDLEARSRDRVDSAVDVTMTPRVSNPAFRPGGYGRAGAWLAGMAVALISAIVIGAIVGMLRRQETP